MRGANFVAFLTVQGFFIGLVFGLLKSDTAEGMLYFTFMITIFFYLFSHLCVAFYFRTIESKSAFFPKDAHEHHLDLIIHEIKKREDFIEHTIEKSQKSMEQAV
jgi:hypothetical protein